MMNNDQVITFPEYLENQDQLERDANEIIQGDITTCFHQNGKIHQLVFSCITCAEKTGNPVGYLTTDYQRLFCLFGFVSYRPSNYRVAL
jgi:hypothetical protein